MIRHLNVILLYDARCHIIRHISCYVFDITESVRVIVSAKCYRE
ncbi:MAG: hypothetical protein ACYCWE_20870 [Eubacteriales bacterium]